MRVGIKATHARNYGSNIGVKLINETPDPAVFDQELLAILREQPDRPSDTDTSFSNHLLLASRTAIDPAVTTLPDAHFRFHEAMGALPETLEKARANYQAVSDVMGLSYELPGPDPSK
jgi:hypothetical protein